MQCSRKTSRGEAESPGRKSDCIVSCYVMRYITEENFARVDEDE